MAERPNPRKQVVGQRPPHPIPLEDAELVERVKAGQTEAFGKLVEKYQDRVFNACWRICGHLEEARDLTQDAFLKAFENIASFRQQSGFYTWIFRVATNLALTQRRQNKRRPTTSLDQSSGTTGTQAEQLAKRVGRATDNDPASVAGETELQSRLLHALQKLDDDHRAVVVLRDIEGLDYREIGMILDIPAGTVRSRLFRARMALRAAILP